MDIWKQIEGKYKVYSFSDRSKIPSTAGIYAWFFPLHIFEDYERAEDLKEFYRNIYSHTVSFEGKSDLKNSANGDHGHNGSWQKIQLETKVDVVAGRELGPKCQDTWKKVREDKAREDVFKDSLLAASLFMPPLYIGKADSLKDRYESHIKDSNFFKKFTSFAADNDITLQVHDLIFCCLTLESGEEKLMRQDKANELLEQVLMRAACPPFSER